ncbi:MAG: pyridoxamine 5-phosphate oxidase [Thermoleophilia bacterium]|nr:pyridoxamine 5-phosphate oxidase [Thermoleophilia bacterium]
MDHDLAHLRAEYGATPLRAVDAGTDPMALFAAWFAAARERADLPEPNAMSVATVGADGSPSARMVLLKAVEVERAAFTWYTNLESRKATEALPGGLAALCIWWAGAPATDGVPGRQVRMVGRVEPVARADAAAYFARRPEEAQRGAAVSRQSRVIASRAELDARAAALATPITLPDDWGGLRLVADELEFWQGRAGRLHDRIAFLRVDDQSGLPISAAGVEAAGGAEALEAAGTRVSDPHGATWVRVRLQP